MNTQETKALVEELGIVPLYADFTNRDKVIRRWLDEFKSESIPLTVIIPGSRPNEPIILRDVFTKGTLLESLRQAGPSVGKDSSSPQLTAAVN